MVAAPILPIQIVLPLVWLGSLLMIRIDSADGLFSSTDLNDVFLDSVCNWFDVSIRVFLVLVPVVAQALRRYPEGPVRVCPVVGEERGNLMLCAIIVIISFGLLLFLIFYFS